MRPCSSKACDHGSPVAPLRPHLKQLHYFYEIRPVKSLSAKMASSNPPWTLTAPTVTRLAIVVDSNGLASLWDVFCRTPVPQFLVLFLRNMYLMPWRLRIRRCRYSMSAFAIFGDLWTAPVAGMLYGTTIQMLLSLLQALANSALDCHSPGQQFFV